MAEQNGATMPTIMRVPPVSPKPRSKSNGTVVPRKPLPSSFTPPTESPKPVQTLPPLNTLQNGTSPIGVYQNGNAEQGVSRVDMAEPTDYMNLGVPHETLSPTGMSSSTPVPLSAISGKLQSALRSNGNVSRESSSVALGGSNTPTGRRSVQFTRGEPEPSTPAFQGHVREDSWGPDDGEGTSGPKRLTLMSKLKSLASSGSLQTHTRNQSTGTFDDAINATPLTPAERSARFPNTLHEESSDADAEETADEGALQNTKSKRKRRRPQFMSNGSNTEPTTPRIGRAEDSPGGSRPNFFRRATDGSMAERGHQSEGDNRTNASSWRRSSAWMTGGRGQDNADTSQIDGAGGNKRPSQFRRAMTNLGAGAGQSEGEATPRRPFLSGDRATTFGAQRWKMIKNGLKLLGAKKEEHKVDYLKSAELMAELRAGAPAALMLASMIQRDEHGNKRIPVLLEQLKLRVTDSKPSDSDDELNGTERHIVFRMELEYGSGLNRMKWTIHRTLRDFANLHLRYKLQGQSDKYLQLKGEGAKQPRFPRSALPYLRGMRGLGDSSSEDEVPAVEDTVAEGTNSDTERRKKNKRRPSLLSGALQRRTTSQLGAGGLTAAGQGSSMAVPGTRLYNERQRRRLEQYLQEMIRWLIFRADSNRLCRFLELSALGVRLAAEGSYHGKEGHLVIQSTKGIDFRSMLTPGNILSRHSPKWFLVRHSYLVCVDSPENMHIYDVYLVDSKFEIQKKRRVVSNTKKKEITGVEVSARHPQHHSLKLRNSERKIKLLAKSDRVLAQFEESLNFMVNNTPWANQNRFDSFAPVRQGVYAQWLVDGRDYMWNVSRAISMAKDVIYIHDWWLSPQLYMRRPAAISQKWRLDRLLQRKAREGVKVFIIVYRNVEAAIPIDSEFTKFSMLDLHPNIFVQRSPNQYKKNQFFFAHHEKICIVDHTVAFLGGLDLCFGRWDTPQHSVTDDKPTGFEESDLPKDADHCQLWPGKDYSNPRVQDFYNLSEPYAEMYDRSKIPRMPWHDVSMQVVGQPARDLTRHFVQRWNYVLRGRKPTRPTPFLLPPPDYVPADLEALGLTGTCEVQILRSSSNWSLGTMDTEHSIMNAYCKMIEESEHFIYMENQFFITSCETMNTKIVNKIGDAIVERALRAYENGESWKCVIVIPLMPGFQNTVDEPEGTSVRLIMQCQFRSICRGETSIFGRLRAAGVEPEDYITFNSLRSWGKIGPTKKLVTEQLYIHAKIIIVDDRIALIGSANINERSLLGNRDSEVAAVVRDTDMIWSTMDGEPYLVGRFAHTLRMRLMREHLGLDVDEVMEEERQAELDREEDTYQSQMNEIYEVQQPEDEPVGDLQERDVEREKLSRLETATSFRSFNHDVDWEQEDNPNLQAERFKKTTTDKRIIGNKKHATEVESGNNTDNLTAAEKSGAILGRETILVDGVREVLVTNLAPEGRGTLNNPNRRHRKSISRPQEQLDNGGGYEGMPPQPYLPRRTTEQLGLSQLSQLPALPVMDDTDIGGPSVFFDDRGAAIAQQHNPLTADLKAVHVDKDCMRDPLNDTFFEDTWNQIAENNTKIFRRVFRCNPDNEVTNWAEYTEFIAYAERFSQAQAGGKSTEREEQEAQGKSGPVGTNPGPGITGAKDSIAKAADKFRIPGTDHKGSHPLGTVSQMAEKANKEHDLRIDTSNVNLAETSGLDGSQQKLGRFSNDIPSPIQPKGDEAFPTFESTLSATNDIEKTTSSHGSHTGTRKTTFSTVEPPQRHATISSSGVAPQGSVKKQRRRGTSVSGSRRKTFNSSDDLMSRHEAEELLSMVQGHLVVFPYDWLHKEEAGSNWLYQVDQVAPLQI